MNKIFTYILFISFLISSILFASPTDKNNIPDETSLKESIPTESRVIIGEGAKVFVGTKQSAKLWYDNIVLLSDAKLIEDVKDQPAQADLSKTEKAAELAMNLEVALPTELSISKAFPNPFNPIVNISYGLPESGDVKILIHDLSGRKIADYSMAHQSAGWHELLGML